MTTKVHVDRSRVETAQRCKRLRYLEYHQDKMGLTSLRKPLPLAVGGSAHAGYAVLLENAQKLCNAEREWVGLAFTSQLRSIEDMAVAAALDDFAQFQLQLDIDTSEQYAMQGEPILHDPELQAEMLKQYERGRSEFDKYLYAEQSALVEAMVRAYARRRLIPLLEQYEVLEVEREGSWLLSEWHDTDTDYADASTRRELWFMSRPDALLLERQSRELYILSFKTAAKWDRRKAEDAKRDMQGLSEGVEVEKRLGEWWKQIQDSDGGKYDAGDVGCTPAMFKFLRNAPAPPRIMGIRYEYLLKGDRWTDKDLTARLGVEVRSQRSPLIRSYKNEGMTAGDETWNVAWEYLKDTGEMSKLYYKSWRSAPVWESMPIKQWIQWLDDCALAVNEENHELGWGSEAQTTGFLTQHPLDELFIPPIIVYRNDDDLRDWLEQTEAQEHSIAEGVKQVFSAADEGERRHLLNLHFPMTRRACEYPTTCSFVRVCYGSEDIRRDPLGSGFYKIRTPNHPQEAE